MVVNVLPATASVSAMWDNDTASIVKQISVELMGVVGPVRRSGRRRDR